MAECLKLIVYMVLSLIALLLIPLHYGAGVYWKIPIDLFYGLFFGVGAISLWDRLQMTVHQRHEGGER